LPEACEACLAEVPSFVRPPPSTAEIRRALVRTGVWAGCRHDGAYPRPLEDDGQRPAVLYGRGDPARLRLLADAGDVVCVVGARRASSYGLEVACQLGRELAAAGLTVLSGMANGVDSAAHEGALAAEGHTVAVLGSGADLPSPVRRRGLYARILERGLVLSELPPGTRASTISFPARNRIMAALAAITIVVEARERSGSLITAAMAGDLGREVGAVPGRVGTPNAEGTNQLLRDGAQLVRCAQDVLDSLFGAGVLARPVELEGRQPPGLESRLEAVLELVERGADTADAVVLAGSCEAAVVAASLARLELLGYLRCDASGHFEPTALAARRPPASSA
jgi:DNA processing protein